MIQTSLVNLHFVDRDNGAVHRGRVVARIEPGWFLYETDACETLRLASVEQMRAWEFHLAEEAAP